MDNYKTRHTSNLRIQPLITRKITDFGINLPELGLIDKEVANFPCGVCLILFQSVAKY